MVRTKVVQPRELVELCLRRIEALDPRVNAFRVTMAEEALAVADAGGDLVGPKPARGRVSGRDGSSDWLGLSVYGALARTVRDSALLLDVMQGTLPGEQYSAPPVNGSFLQAAERPPGRLRIAASRKLPLGFLARLSPDQLGAWERTRELLADLGHEVIERDPVYGLVALEFT